MKRKTVDKSYLFEGIGLHTGEDCRILVAPSTSTKGIVFIKDGVPILAHHTNVVNTFCRTVLGVGNTTVSTVEHLMAALFVHGITDCFIFMQKGAEVPIFDGTVRPFLRTLKSKEKFGVLEPYNFPVRAAAYGDSFYSTSPLEDSLVIFCTVGNSKTTVFVTPEEIDYRCGWAKTYVDVNDVPKLREKGLIKGGSRENAFVIEEGSVLRPNFMAAHKVVDLIGDLALFAPAMRGKIRANLPSHTHNLEFMKFLEINK